MKKLILILMLSLTACANNTKVVNPNIVIAPSEIMKDCDEFSKPTGGTMADFMNALIENKKILVDCDRQNKAKKDFINRQNNIN